MTAKLARRLLLQYAKQFWLTEFPFLTQVELDEIPTRPKGAVFRCDKYFETRGVCYFVSFEFSQHRQGEFGIGIAVSPHRDKSILDPPGNYVPDPSNVGLYNIAIFLNRTNFTWSLFDVDGSVNALFAELGFSAPVISSSTNDNIWKPESYSLEQSEIVRQAIEDLTDKLRRFVFPVLLINK